MTYADIQRWVAGELSVVIQGNADCKRNAPERERSRWSIGPLTFLVAHGMPQWQARGSSPRQGLR